MSSTLYADAEASPEEAGFAIIGAPFELTTCHRMGCGGAPEAIRQESYNFETYIPGADLDITSYPMCDMGDIHGEDFTSFARAAAEKAGEVLTSGAFPILIGGEHSVTPMWLAALAGVDPWDMGGGAAGKDPWKTEGLCVVIVDAHMDFRDGYEGHHLSHASAARRVADIVGVGSVVPFGVRSCSLGEKEDSVAMGLTYVTADMVREQGAGRALMSALEGIPVERRERIYLSVDIDGIDPAHAPGVGTPEPFGIDPLDVRSIIRSLAPRLMGFDVVEMCPPADNGNTAALAARLISETIAWVGRERY